jgi:hypothetical protein
MKTLSQTQTPNTPNKLFVLKNNNREIFSLFCLSRSTYRRTILKKSLLLFLLLLIILLTYKAYIYNRLDINFNKCQLKVHTQFQHLVSTIFGQRYPNLQITNLYDYLEIHGLLSHVNHTHRLDYLVFSSFIL